MKIIWPDIGLYYTLCYSRGTKKIMLKNEKENI